MRRAALLLAAALSAGCAVEERAARDYAELTRLARAHGGMRLDYAPADARWSAADLARGFERIVFRTEFTLEGDRLAARERESRLMKWDGPVRYRLAGDGVSRADIDTYAALARRLSRVTGLDIRAARGDEAENLLILILGRDARREAAGFLRAAGAGAHAGLVFRLERDDYDIPCAASISTGADNAIVRGVILIKDETSGLLRTACAHEEFAQALGPGNDWAGARPSIFNDDQEFALLTDHDEALLRVLYDPRLRPGMTRESGMRAARPIIAEIAPAP